IQKYDDLSGGGQIGVAFGFTHTMLKRT
ncbi:hypothetical protein C5S35_03875, partial [Candidatus Methanophagaceae archaeon]